MQQFGDDAAPHAAAPHAEMGVYVHFPWCLAKCPYCDFVSYAAEKDAIDHRGYADAVLAELRARAEALGDRRVASIFFGGGTPSLWDARELGRVLGGVKERLSCAEDLEVTVECNPTSLDEARARALLSVGVNRLSVGVQSLDGARLKHLGRLHDAAGAVRAVQGALRSGVPRVSADLIFGLPGETPEDATREALGLADLGLSHLSCYQLTIEPGTRFGELARAGRLPLADDGAVAESFLAIDEALEARGLGHYEVSNYARPGEEARHNLGYWRGAEYLGLGCAAYGFLLTTTRESARSQRADSITPNDDAGVRYRNEPLPARYVAAWAKHEPGAPVAPVAEAREPIDAQARWRERIMLGLRVRGGVDMEGAWTPERERAAAWLLARGRIERDGSRVHIPRSAWLWTDDTAARLF